MATVSISSTVKKGKWWNHQDKIVTVCLLYGRLDFLLSFWHWVQPGNFGWVTEIGVLGELEDDDDDDEQDKGGDLHKEEGKDVSSIDEEGSSNISCLIT